jgi:hypothetical protein
MAFRRPDIFLGDLAQAWFRLKPADAEARAAIAHALGWDVNANELDESSAIASPIADGGTNPDPSPLDQKGPTPPNPATITKGAAGWDDRDNTITPSNVGQLDSGRIGRPSPDTPVVETSLERHRLSRASMLEGVQALARSEVQRAGLRPPFHPLFAPGWTKGIVFEAASTPTADAGLNINRIVELIAANQAVTSVPRLTRASVRLGLQLLIDVGEAMTPYRRDQEWLAEQILNVAGAPSVETLFFRGTPLRGAGSGPDFTWPAFQPPHAGTPVLVLTDLGIGRPARVVDRAAPDEWLEFFDGVRAAGSSVVAFVPYELRRVPPSMTARCSVIPWDRRTTAASVQGILRRERSRWHECS